MVYHQNPNNVFKDILGTKIFHLSSLKMLSKFEIKNRDASPTSPLYPPLKTGLEG